MRVRSHLLLFAILGSLPAIGCTGGQGGDPGQTGRDGGVTGGASGMSGSGGASGMGGSGGVGGSAGDPGSSGRGCWGDFTGNETVSMQDARARGFDVDSLLAKIEGVYEADVRWDQPFADPETRLRIELESADSATVRGWDCRQGTGPSCFDGDVLVFSVRVSVATADGRLQGGFDSTLSAVSIPGFLTWVSSGHAQFGSDGERFINAGNGSTLLDAHPLGPLDPGVTVGTGVAVLVAPGREPRVQVTINVTRGNGPPIQTVQALPLDGCQVWEEFYADGESLPAMCSPARLPGGSCCDQRRLRYPYHYPIAEFTNSACAVPDPDADNDGGMVDGAENDAGADQG